MSEISSKIVDLVSPAATIDKQEKWTPYPKENAGEVMRLTQELVAGLERFAGDYNQGIGQTNAYLSGEYASKLAKDYLRETGKLKELLSLFTPQERNELIRERPSGCITGCKSDGEAVGFVTRVEKKYVSASALVANHLTNAINKTSMSAIQREKAIAIVSSEINASTQVGVGVS